MQSIFEAEFYFCVKCMLQIQQCQVFKFSWNFRCKYFKFHANILSNPQILSESLLGFTFIHAMILNKMQTYFTNASRMDFVNAGKYRIQPLFKTIKFNQYCSMIFQT